MWYSVALLIAILVMVAVESAVQYPYSEALTTKGIEKPMPVVPTVTQPSPLNKGDTNTERWDVTIVPLKSVPYKTRAVTTHPEAPQQRPTTRDELLFAGIGMYGLGLFSLYLARRRGTAYHKSLALKLLFAWYLSLGIFSATYLGLLSFPILIVVAWRMGALLKSWRAVRKVLE